MSRLPNEDLFEGNKMSFGEHLEELRVALVRSLFGLAIGIAVGFMISKHVIRVVVTPLEESLKQYYVDQTVDSIAREYSLDKEQRAQATESINEHGLVYQDIFIQQSQLRSLLAQAQAKADPDDTVLNGIVSLDKPEVPDFDFVKVRIWKDVAYRIISTSATEPFLSWMKVGIISGLTISAPWIFLQLWIFVAEGLYPAEKKYVYIYLPFSLLLFVAGACLAYFFVFAPVLHFLLSFNATMGAEPNLKISEWLSFFMLLPLGFGIGFQLPLVMLFLNRIGVVSVEVYLSQWRTAILIIFVAAMFLTPSDPQSMLLLAVPLTLLYFVGIGLCKYLPQRKTPFGEGYDPGEIAESG